MIKIQEIKKYFKNIVDILYKNNYNYNATINSSCKDT